MARRPSSPVCLRAADVIPVRAEEGHLNHIRPSKASCAGPVTFGFGSSRGDSNPRPLPFTDSGQVSRARRRVLSLPGSPRVGRPANTLPTDRVTPRGMAARMTSGRICPDVGLTGPRKCGDGGADAYVVPPTIDLPAGRRAETYVANRGAYGAMLQPKGMTARCRCTVSIARSARWPAGARGGIRTIDLWITSRTEAFQLDPSRTIVAAQVRASFHPVPSCTGW
jgi:hypothetical protein